MTEEASAEDKAYRLGAENMRSVILEQFEALFTEDTCRCYRCLKAAITEVMW